MKEYCKKFLNKSLGKDTKDSVKANSKMAEKKMDIPRWLWLEYSHFLKECPQYPKKIKQTLEKTCSNSERRIQTLFMIGFICGWQEKSKKVK